MTARTGRPRRVCSVADCERRHYGRGYCRTHWTRWRRHGDPSARPARRQRLCGIESCGRQHSGRGLCAAHLARLNATGDTSPGEPIGSRRSPRASYWSVHQRLRAERGPASVHACAECGAPARCWSYDRTDPDEQHDPNRDMRYSLDLDRYRARCLSCHRRATGIPWRSPAARAAMRTTRPCSTGRGCTVPGCEGRHDGHGFCHTHLSRLNRVGDVRADVPVAHKRTHGKVSYWSVHERLRVERGPATAQVCTDCGAAARSWSYDGADPAERTSAEGYRYSLDLDRYQPRCQPCHRRAIAVRKAARPRAAVEDVEQAAWLYERGVEAPAIGALLGVSRTAVYTALRAHGVTIRPRGSRAPLGSPRTGHEPRRDHSHPQRIDPPAP